MLDLSGRSVELPRGDLNVAEVDTVDKVDERGVRSIQRYVCHDDGRLGQPWERSGDDGEGLKRSLIPDLLPLASRLHAGIAIGARRH